MRKIGIVALAVSIVFIIFLLFVVLYQKSTYNEAPIGLITTTISVKHQFKDGMHTYVGDIDTPTPCYSISGGAIVRESYPEQVDVRIEVEESGGVCAQVITAKKFKVSFAASLEAEIRMFVNGVSVLFETTEVPLSVNLEKTEI